MFLEVYSENPVQMNLTFASLPTWDVQHGARCCSGRHLSEHLLCFLKESRKIGQGVRGSHHL